MEGSDSIATTSARIVECVAAATETPAIDLPPLYEAIDPEGLDGLVDSCEEGIEIAFEYPSTDATVTVDDEGVTIQRM